MKSIHLPDDEMAKLLRSQLADDAVHRSLYDPDNDPLKSWDKLEKLYTGGKDPMAPIIGAMYDEGWLAEIAWSIPLFVKHKTLKGKHLTPKNLISDDLKQKFPPGPRGKKMGEAVVENAKKITSIFGGVEEIFMKKSALKILKNLKELDQIGDKKALMLVKDFAIAAVPKYREKREEWGERWGWLDYFADCWQNKFPGKELRDLDKIDIAPDVHCKRVVGRIIGKPNDEATPKELREFGREVYGEFPAWIDTPLWFIGREYCYKENPRCKECPLKETCSNLTRK